jgi:hypothetical protein
MVQFQLLTVRFCSAPELPEEVLIERTMVVGHHHAIEGIFS